MRRFGQYKHGPNPAAFAGLYGVLRFLATHIIRRSCTHDGSLRVLTNLVLTSTLQISNPSKYLSSHAQLLIVTVPETLSNYDISLLKGVFVLVHNPAVALHSTHSEITSSLAATKETTRHPATNTVLFQIYINSKQCIGTLKANTTTTTPYCCPNQVHP